MIFKGYAWYEGGALAPLEEYRHCSRDIPRLRKEVLQKIGEDRGCIRQTEKQKQK